MARQERRLCFVWLSIYQFDSNIYYRLTFAKVLGPICDAAPPLTYFRLFRSPTSTSPALVCHRASHGLFCFRSVDLRRILHDSFNLCSPFAAVI